MLKRIIQVAICLVGLGAGCVVEAAFSPIHVERLPYSHRTDRISETRPSHEVGDADTEEVEIVRHEAITFPPLDIRPNKAHNAIRKVGRLVCGAPMPMVGVPSGAPHAAYGRVSRCEVM
jgi:hypothetical protein